MAHLHRTVVALRVVGDDLQPDEITRLLGVPPTVSQIKGEKMAGRATKIAKFGHWLIRAADREPADMDGQIEELLGRTVSDLAVWQEIAKRYKIELFCGLFMRDINEGFTLSAKSILALGQRGIQIGFDIYEGHDSDHETDEGKVARPSS